MSPNPPDTRITLLGQPLVPQLLSIVIMNFKTRMMHMTRFIRRHEKRMMIDGVVAPVDMHEHRDIFSRFIVLDGDIEEICGCEIEGPAVPFELLVEVLDAETEVAEFMNGGGTWGEAVEFADSGFVGFVVVDDFVWEGAFGCKGLAMDQVYGVAFWVGEGNNVATAGGV